MEVRSVQSSAQVALKSPTLTSYSASSGMSSGGDSSTSSKDSVMSGDHRHVQTPPDKSFYINPTNSAARSNGALWSTLQGKAVTIISTNRGHPSKGL